MDVKSWDGRGLRSRYIEHVEKNLDKMLESCIKAAEKELVSWRSKSLRALYKVTDDLAKRLRVLLEPLCDSIIITSGDIEQQNFFTKILRPIDLVSLQEQETNEEEEEEHSEKEKLQDMIEIITEEQTVSLYNIHELDHILTPIPKAWVKRYSYLTYIKSGTLYVLANESYKHQTYKIGITSRDLPIRMKELQTTGVPLPFEAKLRWQTANIKVFEALMHKLFSSVRLAKNREFFQADPHLIKKVGDHMQRLINDATRR